MKLEEYIGINSGRISDHFEVAAPLEEGLYVSGICKNCKLKPECAIYKFVQKTYDFNEN